MTATPPAAMVQAATATAAVSRFGATPDLAHAIAQAALTAALGVCEVEEEWGIRNPDGTRALTYWADRGHFDDVLAEEPELHEVRRLVITTQPEPVPTEEVAG